MSPPVEIEWDGARGLLRLWLSRPKANLIDSEMISAISEALASRTEMKAVVLDHRGPHFSFGASVEEHLPARCAEMLRGLHRLIMGMVDFPLPILIAARGQCLGGGLEVAAAGHLLFLGTDAKVGQPEIRLGVFAPAASCLLPERIAQSAADDLLLSGRTIEAEDAVRIGLAQSARPDPSAAALAYFDEHLAKHSASSLRFAVAASRLGFRERVKEKLARVERLYLEELMRTADAEEGLVAFIQKRAPRWQETR